MTTNPVEQPLVCLLLFMLICPRSQIVSVFVIVMSSRNITRWRNAQVIYFLRNYILEKCRTMIQYSILKMGVPVVIFASAIS